MIVNKNKDVIIIGHPRSGSFWMQSCLPHFNCRETFNTVNFDILRIEGNRFFLSKYKSVLLDKAQEDAEIEKRIALLNQVAVPKCVKILTFQFQYAHRTEYNQRIFDWVNQQDADIYWIKRKDKLASFKSLLVADSLGAYVGKIAQTETSINVDRLPWLIDSLTYSKDSYIRSQINKPIIDVTYEDLLEDPEFDKSQTTMVEQHSTDVAITNWNQVVDSLPAEVRNDIGL